MSSYIGESDYDHGQPDTAGVLLTNLGTPDAPTPAALRRYLAEFLWDPRVVELPRWLWFAVLHGVILRLRPPRAARKYARVWTDDGAPLLANSHRQHTALADALHSRYRAPVATALGMRYGNPSIAEGLDALRRARCRRILVFPLYPQYSGSTTGSTFDAVADVLRTWRWVPELRMVGGYHDHPAYIGALAHSIDEHWQQNGQPERLLFSFHGLPKRFLLAGDPYHCQCHATARLVARELDLDDSQWQVSFQSRFGREEWLKPYTDHTLKEWGRAGVRHVNVISPGFSADCLETLEEIDMQNREFFTEAGGERFSYIPALNDRPDHIAMMADIVAAHAAGWPEFNLDWSEHDVLAVAEARAARARAYGAER